MTESRRPGSEAAQRSDDELIAAVLAGHSEHFRELMERHQQAIFDYLYRLLLRDGETALDLTQTVFLKAYQNLRAVDRGRPLAPWLYRIAHNEAANHLRHRARHPESGLEDDAWARMPGTAVADPERTHAAAQEQAAVLEAMARLKPRQREVLVLHYFEERSYQEIAEILELPVGTVGTLIHRARNALRPLLEPLLG